MKKKFYIFIDKIKNNVWIQVLFYIFGFLIVFSLTSLLPDNKGLSFLDRLYEIINNSVTYSIFFVGILSVILSKVFKHNEKIIEESLKIEDNHHKIVNLYLGHKKETISRDEQFVNKNGSYLYLRGKLNNKEKIQNQVKDIYSKAYSNQQLDIDNYEKGILYFPSIVNFVNIKGNCKVSFIDSEEEFKIPSFIINNALELIGAHKHSKKTNNVTFRLDDFDYRNNELILKTNRTTYFHMLLTNRCMDFKLSNNMTLRSLYEYNPSISLLNESKLSNQIGINGSIITSDGFLLLEKRDNNKSVWKNKFAQPISLSMKENDVIKEERGIIKEGTKNGNDVFEKIIGKTIFNNYGLTTNDYDEFCFENSFLGIARDLLEGGKPNLYFNVVLKINSQQLKDKVEDFCRRKKYKGSKEAYLSSDKFDSEYYLVPYKDIFVNFDYELHLKRDKIIHIDRIKTPRFSRTRVINYNLYRFFYNLFNPTLKYECGEGLLSTLSMIDLCRDRIEPIKDKGEAE